MDYGNRRNARLAGHGQYYYTGTDHHWRQPYPQQNHPQYYQQATHYYNQYPGTPHTSPPFPSEMETGAHPIHTMHPGSHMHHTQTSHYQISSPITPFESQSVMMRTHKPQNYALFRLEERLIRIQRSSYDRIFYLESGKRVDLRLMRRILESEGAVMATELCSYRDEPVLIVELMETGDPIIEEHNLIPYHTASFFIRDPLTVFMKVESSLLKRLKDMEFQPLFSAFGKYGDFEPKLVLVEKKVNVMFRKSNQVPQLALKAASYDFVAGVVKNNKTFVSEGRLYLKVDLEREIANSLTLEDIFNDGMIDDDNDNDDDDEGEEVETFFNHDEGNSNATQHILKLSTSDTLEELSLESRIQHNSIVEIEDPRCEMDEENESDFIQSERTSADAEEDSEVEVLSNDIRPHSDPVDSENLQAFFSKLDPAKFRKGSSPARNERETVYSDEEVSLPQNPNPKTKKSALAIWHTLEDHRKDLEQSLKGVQLTVDTVDGSLESRSFRSRHLPRSASPPKVSSFLRRFPQVSKPITSTKVPKPKLQDDVLESDHVEQFKVNDSAGISKSNVDSNYVLIHDVNANHISLKKQFRENEIIEDIKERLERFDAELEQISYTFDRQMIVLLMKNRRSVIIALNKLHDFEYKNELVLRLSLCDDIIGELLTKECHRHERIVGPDESVEVHEISDADEINDQVEVSDQVEPAKTLKNQVEHSESFELVE